MIADLAIRAGATCAVTVSEHLPFDIIAINEECKLSRVQCKYCAVDEKGVMFADLRSCYMTSEGSVSNKPDLSKIDAVAIYCPDRDQVFYVNRHDITESGRIWLRLRQEGGRGGKLAHDFFDPSVIF